MTGGADPTAGPSEHLHTLIVCYSCQIYVGFAIPGCLTAGKVAGTDQALCQRRGESLGIDVACYPHISRIQCGSGEKGRQALCKVILRAQVVCLQKQTACLMLHKLASTSKDPAANSPASCSARCPPQIAAISAHFPWQKRLLTAAAAHLALHCLGSGLVPRCKLPA